MSASISEMCFALLLFKAGHSGYRCDEDGGSKALRNVGILWYHYTTLQHRRLQLESLSQWKLLIFCYFMWKIWMRSLLSYL